MSKLLKSMQNTYNQAFTENGAITNKTSFNANLDLFALAGSKRGQEDQINRMFSAAYKENPLTALKIAFYLRDIRGGQGERTTFRTILAWLKKHDVATFNKIVRLVPEYGRWDDILAFVDNTTVQDLVQMQLFNDIESDYPSLLAKWLPSANTSSKDTVQLAYKWMNVLHMNAATYRKILVALRKKIVLVESLMSRKAFSEIDYSKIPSRAGLIYRKAFSKNDSTRYGEYLNAVKSGEKKINAATLYPYDLVGKYIDGMQYGRAPETDMTIEAQWKALPDYAKDSTKNALVMCDVSGSMFQAVAGVENMPIKISVSLAIYIAERNNGMFKNNFITFSAAPQLITLRGYTLAENVREVFAAGVGYNTNIQAAFDMLLGHAVRNHVPVEEMPSTIYIVSDMEFDSSSIAGRKESNFDTIRRKFNAAGYQMPMLVFWNVASRNTNTPITQDDRGYMVSGASPSIFKATINATAVTAEDLMLEVLNASRYDLVVAAYNS